MAAMGVATRGCGAQVADFSQLTRLVASNPPLELASSSERDPAFEKATGLRHAIADWEDRALLSASELVSPLEHRHAHVVVLTQQHRWRKSAERCLDQWNTRAWRLCDVGMYFIHRVALYLAPKSPSAPRFFLLAEDGVLNQGNPVLAVNWDGSYLIHRSPAVARAVPSYWRGLHNAIRAHSSQLLCALPTNGSAVSFLSFGATGSFCGAVNDFFVHCSQYLRLARHIQQRPKILLPADALLREWYEFVLGRDRFIYLSSAEQGWHLIEDLYVMNMQVEVRHGLQWAVQAVLPVLYQGLPPLHASEQNWSSACVLQLKQASISTHMGLSANARAQIRGAFVRKGEFIDFDPVAASAAEKVRLFRSFSVYVTEWGSPLSYAFLGARPAYVFAIVPEQWLVQATDETYQFNDMHHVFYTFVVNRTFTSDGRVTGSIPPTSAVEWRAKVQEITHRVPTTLIASRARDYLRLYGDESSCAMRLWSTCAVDLYLDRARRGAHDTLGWR